MGCACACACVVLPTVTEEGQRQADQEFKDLRDCKKAQTEANKGAQAARDKIREHGKKAEDFAAAVASMHGWERFSMDDKEYWIHGVLFASVFASP